MSDFQIMSSQILIPAPDIPGDVPHDRLPEPVGIPRLGCIPRLGSTPKSETHKARAGHESFSAPEVGEILPRPHSFTSHPFVSEAPESHLWAVPPALPIPGVAAEAAAESDADDGDETGDEVVETHPASHNPATSSFTSILGFSYQPAASADFSDGHTVRQLFEFFRIGLPCAPMFFTKHGIDIERANGHKTFLVRCHISRKNLVGYSFDPTKCNDPARERHIVSFELPDFITQVKSLAKKEGIRLCHFAEQSEFVFGQLYGGNKTTSQGMIFFRVQKHETAIYQINDKVTPDTIPNQVVPLSSFCSACTNAARSKYPYAFFIVYPNGVRIVAGNETGSTGRRDGWGDCSGYAIKPKKHSRVKLDTPASDEYVQIQPYVTCVPLTDIKALMKASNLHQAGIVRIYSSQHQLTRLEIPAGSLCEVTIILQGKDPKVIEATATGTRKKKDLL